MLAVFHTHQAKKLNTPHPPT